jgi:mRNA interferase MazF
MKRGEIYYADLSPVRGSEQGGIRPVLIIQNDIGNKYSPTTIVACLTTKCTEKHKLPTHILLSKDCGLPKDSMALLEQIRTIDKCRLTNKVGELNEADMHKVEHGLMISLGMI